MIDALYIATAGLKSQQAQIDTLSNNISNMQTPGFKSRRVAFGDVAVISPEQVQAGLAPESAGAGSQILSTSSVFSQGQMQQTSKVWDLGIQGAGFLEVVDGGGNHLYTRDGQLHRGQRRLSGRRPGQSPGPGHPDSTGCDEYPGHQSGQIYATVGDGTTPTLLGTIELARSRRPRGCSP